MNKLMFNVIIIIIIGVIIGASGQLLIKKGLSQTGEIKIPGVKAVIPAAIKMITNKFVFFGLLCSAAAAFFWLTALSRSDLSMSYPIALGLLAVFITTFSWLLLRETLTFSKIAGIITIIIGVIILSK
jgi:multidrug transporter EmrE-like cation transporter